MGRTYSDAVTVGTRIDGSHVRVLRDYIQEDLDDAVASFDWTWDDWNAGQDNMTRVLAIHFTEMRDAIQVLWDVKGRGTLPGWTQETPQGPSTGSSNPSRVRATHITDLRAWLNQYENNHPPFTQGVDSKSYDPLEPVEPLIYDVDPDDWTGDVKKLAAAPLCVRLTIRGRRSESRPFPFTQNYKNAGGGHPGDWELFRQAFAQYENQDMKMFPLFSNFFYNPYPQQDYTSSSYQEEFSLRVVEFVKNMKDSGIAFEGLIIWNEPNANALGYEAFVNLLFQCWSAFKSHPDFSSDMPNIYWGGIFMHPETYESDLQYISDCFSYLSSSELMSGTGSNFPWHGINVHIHRSRGGDQVHDILKTSKAIQRSFGDTGELIVGEWGVSLSDGPYKLSDLYAEIRQATEGHPVLPDIMFYFSHHRVDDSEGIWALRLYTFAHLGGQNRFTLVPYTCTPYQWDQDPTGCDQRLQASVLRQRYTTIMGGTQVLLPMYSVPKCVRRFDHRAHFLCCRALAALLILLSPFVATWFVSSKAAVAEEERCIVANGWTQLSSPERSTSGVDPERGQAGILTVAATGVSQDEVYVGGRQGLYRGSPCNANWTKIYDPPALREGVHLLWPILDLTASTGGRVYFSSLLTHPLHVSDNGGHTWRVGGVTGEAGSLVASPTDPDVAYLFGLNTGAMSDARSFWRSVFRTTDAGRTWVVQSRSFPDGSPIIDSIDPNVVYLIGGGRVLRSTDGAITFAEHGAYQARMVSEVAEASGSVGRASASMDGRYMWFIEATGGMYLSTDHGVSWEWVMDAPFGGSVMSVSTSLHDPRVLFVVARGDELWAYREPTVEQPAAP